ncbi:MAG: hypothetical protein P8O00_06500 [Candidatus Marinimicrobia bacterium]|nr:hypothetical protein [Candidatus Neomarinimicrobiota bacterium]
MKPLKLSSIFLFFDWALYNPSTLLPYTITFGNINISVNSDSLTFCEFNFNSLLMLYARNLKLSRKEVKKA